ncbi:hypothetical protein [Saccharopolyspora oryzae]|uniref:Uncharacterized protein n=1 Tax=Saccharopolyspora oryzae TaxID=2997343 RepID=A0ABT4V7X0_9PSEU|nr:hypothetical protein [Saccharopolyspora oryzae]MDA3630073.1 hypothetical protein [Saccharopolyspora oryzae]
MILNSCTTEELDHRARRAEHQLNLARQARQWHLVERHRHELRAVVAECERRGTDPVDPAEPAGSRRTRAMLRTEVGLPAA